MLPRPSRLLAQSGSLFAHSLLSSLTIALTFSFFAVDVRAQEEEEVAEKTLSPYFVVLSDDPAVDNLPLKETSANVNIVGVIADVTVKQIYVNNGKNKLEAIYTFPLSTKAAVYAMEMTIGKRVVTAKIEEKKKAKEQYEAAKKAGKRTSLLEQSRPNVFTMNVANIMVGDTIKVELKYTELLVPEQGKYAFVYPTVVGPRYSKKSKEDAGDDDQFVSTPYTKEKVMPTYKFGIDIAINSGIPIQSVKCGTHKMKINYPQLAEARVSLDRSEANGGNRDVVVEYSLQGDKIQSGVMLYEHGDENFFLAMIQPPKQVLKEDIPPREYVFIVDVSGSMNGFPLEVSKKLMRNLIVNLRPTDKFNVVLFAGVAAKMSPVSYSATKDNIAKAALFIDKQEGSGGTELMRAMKEAFAIPRPDPDISRTFVVVSDGYIDAEADVFDFIRKNSGNTNVFSFGIGSSVNRYLMDGIAFMGSGEALYVMKEQGADALAERFRSYINTPVLTRIKPEYGSFKAYDVEPSSSPDMMSERPIVLFGKYKGKNTGTLTLTGRTGRSTYKQTFDISKVSPSQNNSALRYLWARERIKLLDYKNTTGGYGSEEDTTVRAEILKLGLKYNLMTNYTSFIAVDEELVADKDGKMIRVKQPNPLPDGVSNFAVGHEAPELSTSSGDPFGMFGGGKLKSMQGTDIVTLDEEEIKADSIYETAEVMPSFPGGERAMKEFIRKHMIYPPDAKTNGWEGKVVLTFVVEPDGSISDIKILPGRKLEDIFHLEAIRLIRAMPKWI
ncbi:MAG TPA: TonB family protein, partial [Candidatus Kapabacteria bacterium]|nr:TonB family protein [Candidatus Kapabacteria bacterium]